MDFLLPGRGQRLCVVLCPASHQCVLHGLAKRLPIIGSQRQWDAYCACLLFLLCKAASISRGQLLFSEASPSDVDVEHFTLC